MLHLDFQQFKVLLKYILIQWISLVFEADVILH